MLCFWLMNTELKPRTYVKSTETDKGKTFARQFAPGPRRRHSPAVHETFLIMSDPVKLNLWTIDRGLVGTVKKFGRT